MIPLMAETMIKPLSVEAWLATLPKEVLSPDTSGVADARTALHYQRWLLSDPDKMEERATAGYGAYVKETATAQSTRMQITHSDKYRKLTPETREFYDAYLDDAMRLTDREAIDVRYEKGVEELEESVLQTKKALARPVVAELSKGWAPDERRALLMAIETDPDRLPRLELRGDSPRNIDALQKWADHRVPLPTKSGA